MNSEEFFQYALDVLESPERKPRYPKNRKARKKPFRVELAPMKATYEVPRSQGVAFLLRGVPRPSRLNPELVEWEPLPHRCLVELPYRPFSEMNYIASGHLVGNGWSGYE